MGGVHGCLSSDSFLLFLEISFFGNLFYVCVGQSLFVTVCGLAAFLKLFPFYYFVFTRCHIYGSGLYILYILLYDPSKRRRSIISNDNDG